MEQFIIKEIEAFGNRILRVIVNNQDNPPEVVTVFFDRRLSKNESEN